MRLDEAVCAYFAKDFVRIESILLPLRKEARRLSALALEGRCEWMLGLVRMVQARFVEADLRYAAAIDRFSRLGETGHVVYLRSLRAKNYEFGGARREAWRERMAALQARGAVEDPERLFTIFQEAAQALRRQGYRAAALRFVTEQMRAAERAARATGETALLAYTLIGRAGLLDEMGETAKATADLDRAEQLWSRLEADDESKRDIRVDIDVQRLLLAAARPRKDLAAVDRALAFYSGTSSLGDQIEVLKLHRLRAQVQLQLRRPAAARADLQQGVAEIERQRLEIALPEDRARFVGEARGLFEDLIRLELDVFQDAAAALDVLERSSNRLLADVAGVGMSALHRVPADVLVVRYGHLSNRLLVWTLQHGRLELEQHPAAAADLAHQAQRCRTSLMAGDATRGSGTGCEALARTILPKRLLTQPDETSVVIIPDELLVALPFAALRTVPDAPYFIERFTLSYAPSLALLAEGTAGPLPHPISAPRALFVSDPAFDRERFPRLSRLGRAQEFVAAHMARYPESELLTGPDATVPAVIRALSRCDLLHFDGHGIVNAQVPERGGLLLAPDAPRGVGEESGLLTADDLPPAALKRLRLVILGACSTGLATYPDTAEVAGLAATFLARGVPDVVTAAWDVPDEGAALLLDLLHRELAAGQPTDRALRAAQLALLRSDARGSRTWAAFQLFRGGGGKDKALSVQTKR